MFKTIGFVAILSIICVLIAPVTAFADSPIPQHYYSKTVAEGKFIFVMLSIPDDPSAYGQGGAVQNPKIRNGYTQSGLYLNDGSTEPLWTVDWYAFEVNLSSDGEHLVKWGPWAFSHNYHELALAFYRNGQEITRYHVDDLVADPSSLPHSASHYEWVRYSSFDDEPGTLFVNTYTNENYLFDIKSGDILERSSDTLSGELLERPSDTLDWVSCFTGILAIIIILGYFVVPFNKPTGHPLKANTVDLRPLSPLAADLHRRSICAIKSRLKSAKLACFSLF
ncbi:MAG: hypothetical protein ACPGWR_04865 [Ardenticatenaceae bacterium]